MPRPPQAAAPAPADVDADLGPTGAASPEPPPADTAIPAPAAMSATAPTLIAAHRSPAVPAMIGAVVAALVLAAATMISRGRGGGGADRSAEAGALARAGATPASAFAAGTCGAGLKLCDGQCVSIDHPGYGCGADSCAPCRTDNATARCNNRHQCDIAVCYQDWDDCDGNAANGCESNVRTDPDHCGGCAHRCPDLAHAERGCGDVCTIWRCTPGFRDCNGVDGDGCEANISGDPQNCGRCGRICNAGQTCRRGECEP
jgi:hypothetical protein